MLLVQALYGEVAGIDSFGDPPLRCSKRLFANANLETAKRVRSAQNLDRLDNKNENRRQNPSGYSFEAAELELSLIHICSVVVAAQVDCVPSCGVADVVQCHDLSLIHI